MYNKQAAEYVWFQMLGKASTIIVFFDVNFCLLMRGYRQIKSSLVALRDYNSNVSSSSSSSKAR